MRRKTRGLSLGTTLMVAVLALVIGSTLATVAIRNSYLANMYYVSTQGEMLAKAAAAQFIVDMQSATTTNIDITALPSSGTTPAPSPYSRVINPSDWPLNGAVQMQVTDVNVNETPDAAGTPPFCTALNIVTTVEGYTKRAYVAYFQQVWPYALTTPQPVELQGTPVTRWDNVPGFDSFGNPTTVQVLDTTGFVNSTNVQGPLYVMMNSLFPQDLNALYDPNTGGMDIIPVTNAVWNELDLQATQANQVNLSQAPYYVQVGAVGTLNQGETASTGNLLNGNVALGPTPTPSPLQPGGSPNPTPPAFVNVAVVPGNTWTGTSAQPVGNATTAANLTSLFTLPPVPSGAENLVPWLSNPQNAYQLTVNIPIGSYKATQTPFYLLNQSLTLPFAGDTATYYVAGSTTSPAYFGNMVTTLAEASASQPDPTTGAVTWNLPGQNAMGVMVQSTNLGVEQGDEGTTASLNLTNCVLRVEGSLYLGGVGNGAVTLNGNNATLIVDGDLVICDGTINALDAGMIIYCQRLLVKADGVYNGLILARDGIAIAPGTGQGLTINGGIITGGRLLTIGYMTPLGSIPTASYTSTELFATQLNYQKKYLKSVHGLGGYTLTSLQPVPP